MPIAQTSNFQETNRSDLALRISRLRALLEHGLGREHEPVLELPVTDPLTAVIPMLAKTFGLSAFETELLTLCAAVELDSNIAALCAELHADPRRPQPSFGLAMTVLPEAHWSALTPAAALRFWNLLLPTSAELLARAPLAIDERVLHLIAGVDEIDARLVAILTPIEVQQNLNTLHSKADLQAIAHKLAPAATSASPSGSLLMLCGAERQSLIGLAAMAVRHAGLKAYLLRSADLPEHADERRLLARLWMRETRLGPAVLLLDMADDPQTTERVLSFTKSMSCPLVLLSEQPVHIQSSRPMLRHTLNAPDYSEQQAIWEHALGSQLDMLNGGLPRITTQFSLPPLAIYAAANEALSLPVAEPEQLEQRLWDACRQQARPRLDDLAQRIISKHSWDDIVLPERQMEMLHELIAHVDQRQQVYQLWGFGTEVRGTGTSVIFAGASGTGKTLAAEILANELHLDLYRVDLSGVVSKYIGETEKNLRRIFSAAEYGGAILLFDEADALFGKRSEVRDSHDRYANIEVSYLLQQMESYRGLAILTTNMLENFDRAFLRRVRFVVQFPFPGYEQRAAIWQRAFPQHAPTEAIDVSKLARLNVAGGNIRNIALNAAFLAAHAHQAIGMQHVLRAAVSEYAKLEKALPDSEIRDWIQDGVRYQHRY